MALPMAGLVRRRHSVRRAKGSSAAPRERLLLDFGWRFHQGHAADAAKDFGYNTGRNGSFQKTGNFLPAAALSFDESGWTDVDLPHDWVISLPFKNDPSLASKGFYPIGRSYPENSVGWYRRVFDLTAEDKNKRISVELDGVYREALVVFNGHYIGRHRGGYDPFRFDLTDFIKPDEPNVLLLRVDATESDGWFYEGAGIYRHAWLLKTARARGAVGDLCAVHGAGRQGEPADTHGGGEPRGRIARGARHLHDTEPGRQGGCNHFYQAHDGAAGWNRNLRAAGKHQQPCAVVVSGAQLVPPAD